MLPGFYYFPNVIDSETALNLVTNLDKETWKGITASETGRKVQQYGYEYDYATRKDSEYKKIADIPDYLIALKTIGEKILSEICTEKPLFNQCIVNRYLAGQGISAHIDKETFGPVIMCYTLGSGTTIVFSRTINGEKVNVPMYVEPNSLYFMTGDSRYSWKHEIRGKLTDEVGDKKVHRGTRISVTFRSVEM